MDSLIIEHLHTGSLVGLPCIYYAISDCVIAHYQCFYPCPYSLDLLHSAPENAPAPYYKLIDPSDSNLQDVMTTTCDEDIPDLADTFKL